MSVEWNEDELKKVLIKERKVFEALRSGYLTNNSLEDDFNERIIAVRKNLELIENELKEKYPVLYETFEPFFKRIGSEVKWVYNVINERENADDEDYERISSKEQTKLSTEAYDCCDNMWQFRDFDDEFRDYTKKEIDAFPFEIRCCYYIHPFNKKINPKTVKDWAEKIGWLCYDRDDCFYNCTVQGAIIEANALIKFVKRELRKS